MKINSKEMKEEQEVYISMDNMSMRDMIIVIECASHIKGSTMKEGEGDTLLVVISEYCKNIKYLTSSLNKNQ